MVTFQYSILFPRRCCALKSAFDALLQFTSPLCTPYCCTKLQTYNIIAQHHTIPMRYHTLSYGYKVKVIFQLCTNRLQEFLDHDWIRIRKAKEFIHWILKVNPRSFMLMTQCQQKFFRHSFDDLICDINIRMGEIRGLGDKEDSLLDNTWP